MQQVQQPTSNSAVINGWIMLGKGSPQSIQNAFDIFSEALEKNPTLELYLGKCEASEKLKKFTVTVDTVNNIIVDYKTFLPAQEIKARVLMMIGDWEQSVEVA